MQNVKIGVVWGGYGSGYGNVTVGQIAYKFLFGFTDLLFGPVCGRSTAVVSPAYAATLPYLVYESSFWTSIEVYETSQSWDHVTRMLPACRLISLQVTAKSLNSILVCQHLGQQ